MTTDKEIPILNACDADATHTLLRLWAGACGPTEAYVWASWDDGFEHFAEYLDDHAPGCLVSHEYMAQLYEEACQDLFPGVAPDDLHDDQVERAQELAEQDLTIVGHTSLKHGYAIASHEWGGSEIDHGSDEYKQVLARSFGESLERDVEAIADALQEVIDQTYTDNLCDDCAHMDLTPDLCEHSIDVRLQLSEHGNWEVHSGDAAFDLNHRGYWGASSVSPGEDMDAMRATAKALIDQCLETVAS